MSTQTFPGMEELIDYLKQEKVNQKGASIMSAKKPVDMTPKATAPRNASAVARGGVFRGGLGAAANQAATRGGLGALNVLRAAGPVGMIAATGASLAPVAYDVGDKLGEAYRATAMEDAYKEGNPYVEKFAAEARAKGRPAVGDGQNVQPMETDMMPQITDRQERINPNSMEYVNDEQPITVPGLQGDPNTVAQDAPVEVMPEEQQYDMSTEASDPTLDKIMQLMQAPERTPPFEEVNPEHGKTIERLSTNEAPPRRKIGGWEKFWAAGSGGPVDFTRAERREEELYQLRNKMTDRDRFAGGYAVGDTGDVKNFNRGLVSQNFKEGGMSPQLKFMSDLLAGDRRQDRAEAGQSRLSTQDANQQMERDRQGVKATSESPDMQRMKASLKFMMDNPDFFEPEQLEAVFGVMPKQAGLDAALKSRGKGNEMQQALALMFLERMRDRQGARPGAAQAAPAQEKKPASSANLNLQSLQQ